MNKKRPFFLKPRSLATWLALGLGAFVLLWSVVLMGFFQHLTRLEEKVSLESLGRNNALFMDQARLPQTAQMAERMGRVMGAKVEFRDGSDGGIADGKARRIGQEIQVGFVLQNSLQVWFSRNIQNAGAKPFWKRWDALMILAGFWILSLLFSLWLGRRVTRPLARLAASLPSIGGDGPLEDLPDSGPLEMVSLGKTLRETHDSILTEREKRRHAERLALLGKMAASLAHEVRNPVSAIRLHAQLLERTISPSEQTSAALIVAEAGRIEALVSQWLGYAKPSSVSLVPVDLAALAAETASMLEPQAAHAGVHIHTEIDPDWKSNVVLGDRDRLRQVFGNLLLNAIQAMPKGGKASIRIMPGAVEFTDEGKGFSSTALEKFGEPFHSEREGGMGLGLAVSKEIVTSHGATLVAENAPQGGSVVRICWPKTSTQKS